MAVIEPDGTIHARPNLLGGAEGTSLRGNIRASYSDLERAFGEPDYRPPHGYWGWVILVRTPGGDEVPNQIATLTNPDRHRNPKVAPGRVMLWNVGGPPDADVVTPIRAAVGRRTTIRGYVLAHERGTSAVTSARAIRDRYPTSTGSALTVIGAVPGADCGPGCEWQFEIIEHCHDHPGGGLAYGLEVRVLFDAWTAFADCPDFFVRLGELERRGWATMSTVAEILDDVGAMDETDRW